MSSECLTDEQLLGFLSQIGSADHRSAEYLHIDGCPDCQRRLDEQNFNDSQLLHWRGLLKKPRLALRDQAPVAGRSGSFPDRKHPVVDGYKIVDQIGHGGAAIVYHAEQARPQRDIALKVLAPHLQDDESAVARFQNEARAIARLRHPGIVPVFDVGESGGTAYFTMPLYDLGSLGARIQDLTLSPHTAARIVRDLASAIAVAHAHGIVHRDIKPENVLLSQSQPGAFDLDLADVHVSDFGIAKQTDSCRGITRTGDLLGTPDYMAPEQIRGESPGPACDIFALGVILYRLLAGDTPFASKVPTETLLRVAHEEPDQLHLLNATIPRDLSTICSKCLEKAPASRYATARSLADDLDRFLAGKPVHARPLAAHQALAKWAKRRPYAAALVAVSCAALCALIGLWATMTWQLKVERDQVRQAAVRLEDERNFAVDNFDRAHHAIQKYLASVRTGVNLMTADMLPVRESLLEAGIEFYDDLLRGGDGHDTLRAEASRLTQARIEHAQLHLELGRLRASDGRNQQAVASFDALIAICDARPQEDQVPVEPDFGRLKGVALLSRGECLRQLGDEAHAIQAVRNALEVFRQLERRNALDPGYQDWYLAESLQRLARLLFETGDSSAAREAIDQAIDYAEQLPPIPDYKYALANALLARSRMVEDSQRLADLKQAERIMRHVCLTTVGNRRYQALHRRLTEAIGTDQVEHQVHAVWSDAEVASLIQRAQFQQARWNYDRAISNYQAALERVADSELPQRAQIHFQLGNALFAVRRYAECLPHFAHFETITGKPDNNIGCMIASAFAATGQAGSAERYFPHASTDLYERSNLHGAYIAAACYWIAAHSTEAERAVWYHKARLILEEGIDRKSQLTGQQLRSLALALAESHLAMTVASEGMSDSIDPPFAAWCVAMAVDTLRELNIGPRSPEARFLRDHPSFRSLSADQGFQDLLAELDVGFGLQQNMSASLVRHQD